MGPVIILGCPALPSYYSAVCSPPLHARHSNPTITSRPSSLDTSTANPGKEKTNPSNLEGTACPAVMVSAAVLTVSDTASANSLLDRSGPAAADVLKAHGYHILHAEVVPDDTQLIRQSIIAWTTDGSNPIDLIITTGGTGFGQRDVTPEVLDVASL